MLKVPLIASEGWHLNVGIQSVGTKDSRCTFVALNTILLKSCDIAGVGVGQSSYDNDHIITPGAPHLYRSIGTFTLGRVIVAEAHTFLTSGLNKAEVGQWLLSYICTRPNRCLIDPKYNPIAYQGGLHSATHPKVSVKLVPV